MSKHHCVLFFLILFSVSTYSQTLHLYGGRNHDFYLGCLNCSNYNQNSVWNEYGNFGNVYNSNCIWNEYGTFGSEYSANSPWNPYASNPPVVVDSEGNFYGYLTVNEYKANRAEFELAVILYSYYEFIGDNVDGWYEKLFE